MLENYRDEDLREEKIRLIKHPGMRFVPKLRAYLPYMATNNSGPLTNTHSRMWLCN